MNYRRFVILAVVAAACFFSASAGNASTLVSVRKGEQGGRCWAVMTFDERLIWIGAAQSKEPVTSLYFLGNVGDMDGSIENVDSQSRYRIAFRQVTRNPAVFRADIAYLQGTALAVLKNSRHIVVGFNNDRLLGAQAAEAHAVPSGIPGRLITVSPDFEEDRTLTRFRFDGSYEWVGFLRPTDDSASLIFRGATYSSTLSDTPIPEGNLHTVRLFSNGDADSGFRAEMHFLPSSAFSVARKARDLIVEVPQDGGGSLRMRMAEEPPEAADTGAGDLTAGIEFPERTEAAEPSAADAMALPGTDAPEQPVSFPEPAQDRFQETAVPETAPRRAEAAVTTPPAPSRTAPAIPDAKDMRAEPTFDTEEIAWDDEVSFTFTGTPVKDALRTIARVNGLNMVIDDAISGNVTMSLDGVSLRQALDMVAHTHNCEYIVREGIITVKSVDSVYRGGTITRVYRLKYADAENVARVVSQIVSSDSLVRVFHPEFLNFNEAGKNRKQAASVAVQGIRRSSTLVVTDRPEKIQEVDRVISELDRPPTQIVIESKLVEMAPTTTNEVGINWDKTLTTVLQWQELMPGGDPQAYSMLNQNPDGGGSWQLGHLSASQFSAVLDFLKEKTDSKLISNPRLLAMDNEESSISVGTTVPVPRIQRGLGGQGDMVTFEYKEVNIQLNVTPHVGGDGEITMFVNPVIEEITGWVEYLQHRAPITDKRTVNSIVTVRDGETVVIGGLIKTQRIKTTQKVWLLGSIPLLGQLFTHERWEDKKTELMIFITPRVMQVG